MRTPDPELHRQRADQITTAASEVFLKSGFHGASMQDIARAAGVSMGLLYRYFESKEAIVASVARLDRGRTVSQLRALADADDIAEQLVQFARVSISEALDTRYIALLAEITAESCRNPSIAAILREDQRETRDALAWALEQQKAKGRMPAAIDALPFAIAILTLVEGLAIRLAIDPSEDLKAALTAIASMTRGYIETPA